MQQLQTHEHPYNDKDTVAKSFKIITNSAKILWHSTGKNKLFFLKNSRQRVTQVNSHVDQMRALKLKIMDVAAEFLNSDPDCLNATNQFQCSDSN